MKRLQWPWVIFGCVNLLVIGSIAFFIWAMAAFSRGEDSIGCVIKIRNVQQAVRGYQAEHKLSVGDPLPIEDLIKAGLITGVHKCINGNSYTTLDRVPQKGELYLRCSDPDHVPRGHEEW